MSSLINNFDEEIMRNEINDRLKRKRSQDLKSNTISLKDLDDFSTKDSLTNKS